MARMELHGFNITNEQYKGIRKQAYEQSTTMSEQIRRAITEYLIKLKKRKGGDDKAS